MRELVISGVEFHDAWLTKLEYLRSERLVNMAIFSFLVRDQDAVQVDLQFRGVRYLLSTDLEAWGPSKYIYSAAWGERPAPWRSEVTGWELAEDSSVLHIVMQSGDEMYIAYEEAVAQAHD